MAQSTRPVRARTAHGVSLFVRGSIAAFFAVFSYTGTTIASRSPDLSTAPSLIAPTIKASLSFSGEDVIITGSVDHLFSARTFVGPNRAAKVSRQRPADSVLDVARSFESARVKLASLRNQSPDPHSTIMRDDLARISIAAIDPTLMSAALDAIGTADISQNNAGLPSPLKIPQRLAYARANTPATVFKTPVSMKVSGKQLNCLATAIYFEARGESYRGQVAVAQVVINRVKHKLYPGTICSVVFQNQSKRNACQFSFACDGIPEHVADKKSWTQAEDIAKKVTNGSLYLTEVAGATHYHATYVNPRWAGRMTRVTHIGLHRFYRFKRG